MVKVDIILFFLILRKPLLVFTTDYVSYGFIIYGLYYVEVDSLFLVFIINGCSILLNAFSASN